MTLVDSRGWAKVKFTARYANVSERTFRQWLKDGLEHLKLNAGLTLIKYPSVHEYLDKFNVVIVQDEIEKIVDQALKRLLIMKKDDHKCLIIGETDWKTLRRQYRNFQKKSKGKLNYGWNF